MDIGDSLYQDQIRTNVKDELVSGSEGRSFSTYLSPRIAIYFTEKLNDNIELVNMIDYRFNASYLPYIGCTQIFRITKTDKPLKWKFNLYESLGGYGYLGIGLGFQAQYKKLGAVLGTRHLMAMTNPESLNGFNLHFGLHWSLY